ncbi:bifunctional UDP-sugar hydrolase/5'-nucleotidase [Marichromatium sp. AB31]|uniref:bifunctional metallophosphatase/5'-nucleotidase n=1 Tax=Marichromatium sp. AB31 TaxID=2483362 RepID=UPI000F3FB755|nr:5'-nucleotidase C-terminal domain-containing protein [Marichromatium sp. AB31]RNE89701.1 bifunctional metallophosphatase/5'-nucleotidase [Marichromatium sp. AB31]
MRIHLLVLVLCLWGGAAVADDRLRILHINDHHSHLDPEPGALDLAGLDDVEVEIGGLARVAALIARARAADPEVLVLHAGDAITGTPYHSLFGGEADAAAMRAICFDAFALGNHEFDGGDAGLARFLRALNPSAGAGCRTPVLAANVVPAPGTPLAPRGEAPLIDSHVVLDRGGARIGIVGLDIAGKTRRSSSPLPSTRFLDERETAQREIDALTAQGIERIVLLTHYQYANDLALARALRGVDVIVGGDSHSLLGDGLAPLGLNPVGPYPSRVHDLDGNPVCVVQAWQYAALVGELEVVFDAAGRVRACTGTPRLLLGDTFSRDGAPLDPEVEARVRAQVARTPELVPIAPDPAVAAVIARYADQVKALGSQVVGEVSEDLCFERIPGEGQSARCDRRATQLHGGDIQQLVAQAYLARGAHADVALLNAGAVRIDLPAGPLTLADVYRLLPFGNTLVELELSGRELRALLEGALASFLDGPGSNGAYPYAANLRWTLDLSRPAGERLSALSFRRRGETHWRPLGEDDRLSLITNSFLAAGRDGYEGLAAIVGHDIGTTDAQVFIEYLQRDLGGAAPGAALLAVPPRVRPLPCAEYSTQRLIGRDGDARRADPEVPAVCASAG